MEMSNIDNLKSSRRLQAHKMAQKLRLQPIDYVEKSVATQNEWEKIGLAKSLQIIDRDSKFQDHKLENERRQFVVEQRRLLKPVFDGKIIPAEEFKFDVDPELPSAYQDLDSDLLRIVQYYEIHKPNTVKRIHTIKHMNLQEEKQWRAEKLRQQKLNKAKIGIKPQTQSTNNTPRIEVHIPNGSQTHRGDLTEHEREELKMQAHPSTSQGFYLSTGIETPDLGASLDSNKTAPTVLNNQPDLDAGKDLDRSFNEELKLDLPPDTDDEAQFPIAPTPTRANSLIPLHIVPPSGARGPSNTTPDKRFQSPPSTKKFRNYKMRSSLSDRAKLTVPSNENSQATTPINLKGKSFTPFSDDVRLHRQPDGADLFGSSDADFKAALTESNLKLHTLRTKHGRRTPRPEPRRGLLTPSLANSLENLTVDEFEQITQNIDGRLSRRSPLDVHDENHTILNPFIAQNRRAEQKRHLGHYVYSTMDAHTKAVHETIPENPKRSKPKYFKSKRYGDCYLVPSDVKRTCEDVAFDPYVLSVHKKEIDEIETRKRLEDIKGKIKLQRQNAEHIQSNINEWVKNVDKSSKAKRMKQIGYTQSWSNFA